MAPKRTRDVCQRPFSKESSFTDCPACQMKVVSYLINHHLDLDCLALVKPKEQALIAEAGESKRLGPECKGSLSDSIQRDPALKASGDKLPVNQAYSEFGGLHNVDVDGAGVPAVDDHGFEKKPCRKSFQQSSAFNLNDHELGVQIHSGGQPDTLSELESKQNNNCMKSGKQPATTSSSTRNGSEAELNNDNLDGNVEENEKSSSCWEDAMLGRLHSVDGSYSSERKVSSTEANNLSPRIAKNDGWGFIMASLSPKVPRGHHVLENFLSENEEQEVLSFLDTDLKNPWKLRMFNGLHMGKAYGLSTDLINRCVRPAAFQMPKILVPVFERMRATVPILKDFWPNETNAIDYCKAKGHWLKPHVDDRQLSGTILVNLSLCGDCKMTYERERGARESYKVLLRRRSIQIQSGECRYNFTHSILNEDILSPRRVSMTFRQSVSP